ncbi:MAG TPA: hypothetical protein VGE52_03210, partial [Pirellulales bacterium]
ELRIELEPFSEEDTFAYVRERLTQAGRADRLFSNAALSRLHELSAGSVRMINDLAELALVAAAAQDMECVDTEIVDGAYSELGHVEFRRRAA